MTSFIRTEMIEGRPAPNAQSGVVHWLRSNLFATLTDTIVSLLFIAIIAWLCVQILGWAVAPTISANSITECQAMLANDLHRACWGVIRERWVQLLVGFYPASEYWRIAAAAALVFCGMLPILRGRWNRTWLVLSLASPFLCVWLLWGGTIWWVLCLGALALLATTALRAGIGAYLATALFLVGLFGIRFVSEEMDALIPLNLDVVPSERFGGFALSILIGLSGIVASFPLGVALALGRQSKMPVVRLLSIGFIEFIRAVPLITLLFVASTLLNLFLPPGTSFDIILRVIIIVTLFSAAYIAEVIRGGLAAIPKGQYEAADALGLTYWQSMRLIVLPQALKISIPGIVSNFISLFKDTTLVSIIGLLDPIGLKQTINGDVRWASINWEIYGFIALLFFIFCFSMSRYAARLEAKLNTDHR